MEEEEAASSTAPVTSFNNFNHSNGHSNSNTKSTSGITPTAKRITKDSKSKIATGAGSRFQCPSCPKNFSRIENLTRHQANHDDVGKFACPLCKKRFTRSDLLNRHRRIHGNQTEASTSHVTKPDSSLSPGSSIKTESHSNSRTRELPAEPSPDHSSNASVDQPDYRGHLQQPPNYTALPQEQYRNPLPQDVPRTYVPPVPISHANHSQGLASLMEAALAPPGAFDFTPAKNINPMMWDGFMSFTGDGANPYQGTYDADMSWTLNHFQHDSSPDYSLDYDMMANDFMPSSFQPAVPFDTHPPHAKPTNTSDDDDTADWPDKSSRPGTPVKRAPRIIPLGLLPTSWQPVLEESRALNISMPFNQRISSDLRLTMMATLNETPEASRPRVTDAMFPPPEALDYFLRLYFMHVYPRFPILHIPTFDIYQANPLFVVTLMFVGSSHSKVDSGRFCRVFYQHVKMKHIMEQEVHTMPLRVLEDMNLFFHLNLAGTWSGSKQMYTFSEGSRGVLVTACRRARLLDCRPSAGINPEHFQRQGIGPLQAKWMAWIETEKRKRLGLCLYLFDCQYPALFNNQPYVSKAETTNCVFPVAAEYWDAPTAESWKTLVGPADAPPATYYLQALNGCLLHKYVTPTPPVVPVDDFGKLVLLYAIHTHIFEWRQSTSMLNPTGLMGASVNMAHDMGKGLRERRRWLSDALDSWGECYRNYSTSVASNLMYHLGYVSLDVSLSDIHLAAGRSAIKHDNNFAEENLKYWANSEISDGTMTHIFNMFDICHHSIANGTQGSNSYEIAVSLFTAGMVCCAYAKLRVGVHKERYREQVIRASTALQTMGCWKMCSVFGKILAGFESPQKS